MWGPRQAYICSTSTHPPPLNMQTTVLSLQRMQSAHELNFYVSRQFGMFQVSQKIWTCDLLFFQATGSGSGKDSGHPMEHPRTTLANTAPFSTYVGQCPESCRRWYFSRIAWGRGRCALLDVRLGQEIRLITAKADINFKVCLAYHFDSEC